MHIIHFHHVTVNYTGREIFNDLTFAIGDRDRTGLVGPNGAGKSTLLKVIRGMVQPDSGHVVIQNRVRVGYLQQDIDLRPGCTLIEEAMVLPPVLEKIEGQLREIEQRLGDPDVYNNADKLSAVLEEQATLLEQYERMNGNRHPAQVKSLLTLLGFNEADYDLPAKSLSGGQKKLVALVRLAVSEPDVLLLDEPDNHLDMEGKRHLERFIRQYNGCVLLVSHDRYLLDDVATKILELEAGRITEYHGNYTAYTTERELQRLRQQQQYVAQQKEIARIEAAIARFELWASMVIDERHIKQARSRRKMLERMEERGEIIEKVVEAKKMGFELSGWRGSKKVLELVDIAMAFDDDLIFTDVNLILQHGERVGLIGPNGAGKSVLMKLILEQLAPYEGIVKLAPGVTVGYYSQEHQTLQNWLDKTPLDLVRNLRVGSEQSAVAFLMKMLFSYDQVRQTIKTMSGGERSRLQLAILMIQEPNFLLLDEPTNNLDIAAVEVLESVLDDFNGTIFTISHDRYFLDNVVDKVVELRDGAITPYPGGYTDFLEATGQLS